MEDASTKTGRILVAGVALMAVVGVSGKRVAGGPPPKGIELKPLGVYTALYDGQVFFDKGDRGAEAARVVPAELSPNGKPLLIVSNEVSGSLRVFEIAAKN